MMAGKPSWGKWWVATLLSPAAGVLAVLVPITVAVLIIRFIEPHPANPHAPDAAMLRLAVPPAFVIGYVFALVAMLPLAALLARRPAFQRSGLVGVARWCSVGALAGLAIGLFLEAVLLPGGSLDLGDALLPLTACWIGATTATARRLLA